jgi:hypothetical protein
VSRQLVAVGVAVVYIVVALYVIFGAPTQCVGINDFGPNPTQYEDEGSCDELR